MASVPKRRALDENEHKSSSDESDAKSEPSSYEEIEADFEGRNPEPSDFDGIRQLLKQLFLKEHMDVTQLADMIIAQVGIGSVLKQSYGNDTDNEEEDSDSEDGGVFGVTTVINLGTNRETAAVKQLLALVKAKAKQHLDKAQQTQLNKLLESWDRMGLLINERYVNIPPRVADPLFASLTAEVQLAAKRDQSYNFRHYIMVIKLHKSKDTKEVTFSNAEEEIFSEESLISVEYKVEDQSDTGVGGKWTEEDAEVVPYRCLLLIPAHKLPVIVHRIKTLVS